MSLSVNAFGVDFQDPARSSYALTFYFPFKDYLYAESWHGLFPPFALFLKSLFPHSTRCIAGLSLGVGCCIRY